MSRVHGRFSQFARSASVFSLVSAVVLSGAGGAASGRAFASEAPERASEAVPEAAPMAGHDSEARVRAPDAEARWRRLHFDPAPHEDGEAGVSCDHRRGRRPDAIRGLGAVAIAIDRRGGRLVARAWVAPEGNAAPAPGAVEERLRRLLADRGEATEVDVEVHIFAWCR